MEGYVIALMIFSGIIVLTVLAILIHLLSWLRYDCKSWPYLKRFTTAASIIILMIGIIFFQGKWMDLLRDRIII